VSRLILIVATVGCGPFALEEPEQPSAFDDPAAIRSFIKQHGSAIAACLPADSMSVLIRFTVGPHGSVQRSTADGEQRRFENCVADALAGIEFPRPAGAGTLIVSYPWR